MFIGYRRAICPFVSTISAVLAIQSAFDVMFPLSGCHLYRLYSAQYVYTAPLSSVWGMQVRDDLLGLECPCDKESRYNLNPMQQVQSTNKNFCQHVSMDLKKIFTFALTYIISKHFFYFSIRARTLAYPFPEKNSPLFPSRFVQHFQMGTKDKHQLSGACMGDCMAISINE